jgi:uncharacterized protein (TIGR03083 family)
MTPHDDDLAVLLALDALEPDEQADAELRLGTFPAGVSSTAAALGEAVTAVPPPDLRERTLGHALDRRPPGRPVEASQPCTPAEAFHRTIADFEALLRSLSVAEWDAPAHAEHGAVRDLVAHLVGVERISARWLRADPDLPQLPDHVAATRDTVAELRDLDPNELVRIWSDAVGEVVTAATTGDPARPVQWHDITLNVHRYFTTRTFELWAHGMDIALATGRPMPTLDYERMALLSSRLMAVVPHALAYRGSTVPGRAARFVLTGPAGGAYTVPLAPNEEPGDPAFVVVTDVVDVCRVAARRLRPADLPAAVEGDRELAGLVLGALDAFARD